MLLCCITPLPGSTPSGFRTMADLVVRETMEAHQQGASVILWPEYLWSFCNDLEFANSSLLEKLLQPLKRENLFVLAGTWKRRDTGNNTCSNTAIILSDATFNLQDKIALAPRERDMVAGQAIPVFSFKGLKIACLICMDVEMPELSAALKKEAVDILLVPSQVEDSESMRRIAVCAEARSIELGCYTAVCPLQGSSSANLPEAIGEILFFHPAQQAFAGLSPGILKNNGNTMSGSFFIDAKALRLSRRNWKESAPFKIHCPGISPPLPFQTAVSGQNEEGIASSG